MRSYAEILESVSNIEKSIVEMEEMGKLYGPLVRLLLPLRKEMCLAGVPLEGRSVSLCAKDWPKQFEKGVDRVVGFDIKWQGAV